MTDIIAKLTSRDVIYQVTHENLDKVFSRVKSPVYCGFDPTAPSLHLGHLLPIIALMRFQKAGFKPLALVGGATGLIGDPSGKSAERMLLSREEIEKNARTVELQLKRFLDFDHGSASAEMVNNADWFEDISFIDFLRDVGKHFSIGTMLGKEAVRNRLETGLSFTEFSYILLQAYDFLHLFDAYRCRVQIGGQDQWGNITAGVELIRKLRGKESYGITFPLLTDSMGKKFGKSEDGALWLDKTLTSPYQLYQYLINTSDLDVIRYLKLFTFLSAEEISECEALLAKSPEKREPQKRLALEVISLVHGRDEARFARKASEVLFGGEVSELTDTALEEIFGDVPKAQAPMAELAKGLELIGLLVSCGASQSRGAARRLIEQGGIYVNNRQVRDISYNLTPQDLASEHFIVIRSGKKRYFLVRCC